MHAAKRSSRAATRLATFATLTFACACGPDFRQPHASAALDEFHVEPAERPPDLRVLTLNTWSVKFREDHERIVTRLASIVASADVDVIALQEVWRERDARVFAQALREGGFEFQRHEASDAPFSHGSSGLLLASRLPLVDTGFEPFEAGTLPWWPWPVDWFAAKGVLAGTVQTARGPVRVLNTHLHAAYGRGGHAAARVGQALELRATAMASSLPTLVVGDLNTRPGEPPFSALMADSALRVVARSRVDAILARDGEGRGLRATAATVAVTDPIPLRPGRTIAPSDHLGVQASLSLRDRPAVGGTASHGEGAREVLQREQHRAGRHRFWGQLLTWLLASFAVLWLWRRRTFLVPLWLAWGAVWSAYHGFLVGPEQEAQLQEQLRILDAE
ncbi:MAG: endonuclease/exonuclease/phosphatase family protein [Myxococcota bacterium]